MSRSTWKHNYLGKSLPTFLRKKKSKKWENTWLRKLSILPSFIGHQFNIYNGQKLVSLKINEDMVLHKLGEFSPTRKKYVSKLKKKNLLKRK